MPGISVSKICVPFGGGGINWSSYWTTRHPELDTYLTGLTTPLSTSQIRRLGELIEELKTGLSITNLSEVFDVFYILAGETQESTLRNIVKDAHHATSASALYIQYVGYMSSKVASYINTNYNPSTEGDNFKQNDASFGVYSMRSFTGNKIDMGVAEGTTQSLMYTQNASDKFQTRLNNVNTSQLEGSSGDGIGLYVSTRNGSSINDLYGYKDKDTLTTRTGVNATSAVPNKNFYILVYNPASGSPTEFNSKPLSFAFIGKHITTGMRDVIVDAMNGYLNKCGFVTYLKATPSAKLVEDSCVFRCVVNDGVNYHLFEESSHADYPTWTIEKRISADEVGFGEKSTPLLAAGEAGQYDERGQADPTVLYEGPGDWKMWFDAVNGSNVWDKLGYATSGDGITWTKYGPVISRGSTGAWDSAFIHHPVVIKHNGLYYMYYAGAASGSVLNYKIGLATSPDGITWTKYGSAPVIDIGSAGEFDNQYVRPSNPVLINGHWYMWYWGMNDAFAHSWGLAKSEDLYTWVKCGYAYGRVLGELAEVQPTANYLMVDGDTLKFWFTCLRPTIEQEVQGELYYATAKIFST